MRSDFLVYEAKSFYNAYISLEQLSKADTTPELLLYAPMVVNGSFSMQLRLIEKSKIHCAREHFKAISSGNVVYDVVDSYQTLLERVMK